MSKSTKKALSLVPTLIVGIALAAIAAASPDYPGADRPILSLASPRVIVLKGDRVLHLFDGHRLVRSYPVDLAVEDATVSSLTLGATPVGRFRIVSKNVQSRYHRFLGLSFPDPQVALWGNAHGLISVGEVASINEASKHGRRPDWRTALGGGIGIHGSRTGRNWTGGCIALADEHVAELYDVLRIGDTVEILP